MNPFKSEISYEPLPSRSCEVCNSPTAIVTWDGIQLCVNHIIEFEATYDHVQMMAQMQRKWIAARRQQKP